MNQEVQHILAGREGVAVPVRCFFCERKIFGALAFLTPEWESEPLSSATPPAIVAPTPCDRCAALMVESVLLIEVLDEDADRANPRRTGPVWVVSDEWVRAAFSNADRLLEDRFGYASKGLLENLGVTDKLVN